MIMMVFVANMTLWLAQIGQLLRVIEVESLSIVIRVSKLIAELFGTTPLN